MTVRAYSSIISVAFGGPLRGKLAARVAEARIDLGSGVPGAFEVSFNDPHHTVLADAGIKMGTKVQLSPVADGKGIGQPIFTGEVTALEAVFDGRGSFTVVRGYDAGHRMLRSRRVAKYEKQSAATIVRKLATQNSVPVGKIENTPGAFDFIAQDNITDWDFALELADRSEKILYIDERGRLQFVARDRASGAPSPNTPGDKNPLVLKSRVDIQRLQAAVTSADQAKKVEARGWNVQTRTAVTATAPATSNPGISIGITPAEAARPFKATDPLDASIPYDQKTDVTRAAKALADDLTSSFAELEMTVNGNPKLRPDVAVALADVGKPFEGRYTVTAARHIFVEHQPYQTWLTVSGRQWRSLYGTVAGAGSTRPRLPSVVNAVVTDVRDPLKQGRVKLKFPWLDAKYVSDWARTVQLGGVKGGSIMPFDVNDEVLVAFDRGVLDHPYVIGGLYNGRDKPPRGDVDLHDRLKGNATRHTVADRENNRMDLLSRKLGGGRPMRGVRLRSGDDRLTVFLDRTKTEITVDSRGDVSIRGAKSVSVSAGKDLSLKAGGNLSLRAGGSLTMNSGAQMSLESGLVSVTALEALNLSATADASIKAAGGMQIMTTNMALTGIVDVLGNLLLDGQQVLVI